MNCLTAHSNLTPQFSTGSSCKSKRKLGRQNVITHAAIRIGRWVYITLPATTAIGNMVTVSIQHSECHNTKIAMGTSSALLKLNCNGAEHNLSEPGQELPQTQQLKFVLHLTWKMAHCPSDIIITQHSVDTTWEERSSHTVTSATSPSTCFSSASFPEGKQGALFNLD